MLDRVAPETEVIGIDEGQFFDLELPMVCDTLADRGKRVIVAGLDQDYLGKPFDPMPQLLAIAEYITKTHAICMVCGNPANHTQRLVASGDRVLVGAQGVYEARCRLCFDPLLAGPPSGKPASPKRQEAGARSPKRGRTSPREGARPPKRDMIPAREGGNKKKKS
jgi:thymidine kinase